MVGHTIIDTTKVIKNIDPLDVPAYKMKLIYQHRNDSKKAKKPVVGNAGSMYAKVKNNSLFPSILNKSYLLHNM